MADQKCHAGDGSETVNPPPYTTGRPWPNPHPKPYGLYPEPQAPNPQSSEPCGPAGNQASVAPAVIPVVVVRQQMGPHETRTTCGTCHAEIVSRIERNASRKTHLIALLLCLVGCWPCCCIPYCMDSCMATEHYCPNCNTYLGSYQS